MVIAPCTNRKRQAVPEALRAGRLPEGPCDAVAAEWAARLVRIGARYRAGDLYGGRGFQEAVGAAGRSSASLVIVSAGLGLIEADAMVPAYDCTVVPGAADGVLDRVTGPNSARDWWAALSRASPFSHSLGSLIERSDGPILCALPDAYLTMLSAEIGALAPSARNRIRIFTRAPLTSVDGNLRDFVMPYDDRLDGPQSPLRGTRSDFAQRALGHFVDFVLAADPAGSASDHARAVDAILGSWSLPAVPARVRHDDETLRVLLREHWQQAGGRSSALLRIFRDDLHVACEQGRFAKLVREMREELA